MSLLSKIFKSGKSENSSAQNAADQQAKILQDQWDFYKQYYLPQEEALAEQSLAGIPVDYLQDRASQDVTKSFDQQRAISNRGMERYGIPASTAEDPETKMIRAAAEIGARNMVKSNAKTGNLERLNAMMRLGQGIPSTALSGYQATTGMYGTAGLQKTQAKGQLISSFISAGQQVANSPEGQSAWNSGKSSWGKLFSQPAPTADQMYGNSSAYGGYMSPQVQGVYNSGSQGAKVGPWR